MNKSIALLILFFCFTFNLCHGFPPDKDITLEKNIKYDIIYEDKHIGSQIINIGSINYDGSKKIYLACESVRKVKGLFKTHEFQDNFRGIFDPESKDILEYEYHSIEDKEPLDIIAKREDDKLYITKKDSKGSLDLIINKGAWDTHSMIMYLDKDMKYLNGISGEVLVFSLEKAMINKQVIVEKGKENVISDVDIGGILENKHSATHIIWKKDKFKSQSWNVDTFGNLPVQYLYQDSEGDTLFVLKKYLTL